MNSSVCSHCGEKILSHWTLCPVCALPFADAVTRSPQTSIPSIEAFAEPERYSGLTCVQCKSSIDPDAQICSRCHVLIVRRYCSGCSRLIPDQASYCPYCATPASAKKSRIKAYLKFAAVFMIAGSVVAGVLVLVKGKTPARSKSESLLAPASDAQFIPDPPKPNSFQLIPERVQEPEQFMNDEAAPVTSGDPDTFESASEERDENADVLEQHQQHPEGTETIPEEEPAEGDWQNRGAKLMQGRKLTIRASQLMQKGRYSEASVVLKAAINMFPHKTRDLSYGEALYKLGICLRRKGQPEQAIPVLREAMQFPYYRSKVLREVEAATGQLERRVKVDQTRG